MSIKKEANLYNSQISTILTDYLHHSCAPSTLKLISTDNEKIKDAELRKKIFDSIIDSKTHLSLELIKNNYKNVPEELINELLRHIFIESVHLKEYTRAIAIAKEYMGRGSGEDAIFSILGYKNDDDEIKNLCSANKKILLAKKVNEELFGLVYGRKKALIDVVYMFGEALEYYKNY